ncbi:MAG: ABC transporter substrate-binding protein [Agathobacter sp.]|uniref:ABC transporter substrate-binding protein n=1 Tax=Agathobacter sp. TaxID=2021311 RepID=UPI00258A08C0|nr:ABC transporter substrate-binding protein [Agathobacter sp.]MCR5678145.1 ABC transporter substrate-binding protein [Agathobacter sp.]
MRRKKFGAVLLAAAMSVSLIACGSSNNSSTQNTQSTPEETGVKTINVGYMANTEKSDETVVIELGSYPDNLWHPLIEGASTGNEEAVISSCFLDRLVNYDPEARKVIPGLAESYEVGDKDITFHIRQGVKMTDGSDLTADDVVYSANLWKTNGATSDTGKYIEGVEKVDDTTVKITFNVPAVSMERMLTWSNFGIVSEDEINALGGLEKANTNPVMGCGKYKFKEAKTGEYIILERNDNYWDSNYTGYFKEIKFIFVADANAAIQAVQAGDAQVADQIAVSQAATFAENESVHTYLYPNGEMEHLFFNMGESHVTSDIRVRQAIAKCLNYDAITATNTAGFGTTALSYFDPSAGYYVEGWTKEEMAQDIEGAKALLEEAGYNESNPLEIVVYTMQDQVELYTVMQNNLAQAGITLKMEVVDMGGFVPALLFDKTYDIVAIGDDTSYRGPQTPQFVCEGIVFGGFGIPLPEHEEILNRLVAASSDEDAKAIATEYNEKIKKDCSVVNLCQNYHAAITATDLKGVTTRERGFIDPTNLYK